MRTGKGARPPHLLVMTATPIPRTLQLANHGEMDVSRIDEMPPGRTPVDTRVVSVDRLDEVVSGLERHLAGGAQAYWGVGRASCRERVCQYVLVSVVAV